MVPCHSCHIYGIWTSRSKKVWEMLKIHQLGVALQDPKGGLFSQGRQILTHYVILLYCETLLQVLLGIYCKRFYWMPLFIILLFYMFVKSATQSVLMILTLNRLFQKNFQVFYFTPENSMSLTLPTSPCLFFSVIVCTVISDCNHPFDTSTFTHTVSQEYIIAIENTYLNRVF